MGSLPPSDVYDTGGAGPVVVFSHGTLLDRTMFDSQIKALSAGGYRSIAYTSRAGTSRYGTEKDLDDLATDCLDVVDQAGIEQFVLVGMSVGGFMAIELALQHVDRLAGLVLISSMADAYTAAERLEYGALLEPLDVDGVIPEHVVEAFVPVIFGPNAIANDSAHIGRWTGKWRQRPARSLWGEYRSWIDRTDRVDRLLEISVPSLVIHAVDDGGIDIARGELMARHLTDVTYVPVASSGHLVTEEQPDAVNDALVAFVDALQPWGSSP